MSDAQNTADLQCGKGGSQLIPGRKGYSPEDYRCVMPRPTSPQ